MTYGPATSAEINLEELQPSYQVEMTTSGRIILKLRERSQEQAPVKQFKRVVIDQFKGYPGDILERW